jgi:hypothetical protein
MNNIPIESTDQLVYGNISREYLPFLKAENEFTELKRHFIDYQFPDVEETSMEINKIIDSQKRATENKSWENYRKFMMACDTDFNQFFAKELARLGFEMPIDKVEEIQNDLVALILQLKMHYQRPRPFLFSYYTQQELNPFSSVAAQTPAYPSGHSTQAYFTAAYLGFLFPIAKDDLLKIAQRISQSREVMGIHYHSDLEFGKMIATALTKHPKIIKKYFVTPEEVVQENNEEPQ